MKEGISKYFLVKEKNTTIKTEIVAGFTTFMAVAYILFVNPNILADAGIPKEAAFAATVYAASFASIFMGLYANFPVAVAPGMGINAFFAYYICGTLGLPWQTGLGAVFISGIVFFLLTVTHVRQMIIVAVPANLKSAIVVGIGLFIAFIGLKNAGIVTASPATYVTLGNLANAGTWLACFGTLFTAVLMSRNIKGAILYGILITTVLGMIVGATPPPKGVESFVSFNLPSLAPTLLQLDIMGAISYGVISIIFTLTIVDLFDNMGTLIGVGKKANLSDKDGNIQNIDKALIVDSTGTIISSLVGTSTVTSYIESAAGVAEGGRTGIVAIVVGVCMLLAIFFAPLVGLVPAFATAPALLIVGAFMLVEMKNMDISEFTEAFPVFMMVIMMPLTFSIANGFAFGFVSYVAINALSGKINKISPIMWIVAACFVVNFVLRMH